MFIMTSFSFPFLLIVPYTYYNMGGMPDNGTVGKKNEEGPRGHNLMRKT
jgi:hypothetical protein